MSDSEAEVEQVVNADEDGGNTQPGEINYRLLRKSILTSMMQKS